MKSVCNALLEDSDMSLPMRGEWIEIPLEKGQMKLLRVSPHAGRVD